eukprot:jgi/Tetstr1/439381/TSEL_027816.t1
MQLDPVLLAELEAMRGAHSVDRFAHSVHRFALAMNAMLSRYNAAWLDPSCEAVDSLHLADAEWRRENNYCNPMWSLLPDLIQKLRQNGDAATVVALRWESKVWHHALTEIAAAERVAVLTRRDLFRPGRRAGRDMPGAPHLAVSIFRAPFRRDCAPAPRISEGNLGAFPRTRCYAYR